MSATYVIPAYAKINLTLDVLARRSDGYHDIRSVMQTVSLKDTIELTPAPDTPGVTLAVIGGEAAGVPSDASNIVHRAAVRLQKTAAARGIAPPHRSGLHITLTKAIPSQAGLGGGSSDAAATLMAVNTLLSLGLTLPHLTRIAASLGADVPFFLTGGTALVEGLGERVTPLAPLQDDWQVVIVKPPVGVSTVSAYAALDADGSRSTGDATADWLAGDRRTLGNDFQDVILKMYPAIALVYEQLASGEGRPPLLCGSGSALFRLVPDEDAARKLAARLRAADLGAVWVTQLQRKIA